MNKVNEADGSTEEAHFQKHIFYVVLRNVIGELTVCFSAENRVLIPQLCLELPKDVNKKRIEPQSI